MRSICILAAFLFPAVLTIGNAQLPDTLIQIAQNDDVGYMYRVAFGADRTVFAASGSFGLRAFVTSGDEPVVTARSYLSGEVQHVAVGPDGTVYCSNDYGHLFAFSFDGGAFHLLAQSLQYLYSVTDLAVGQDGTLFVSVGDHGLYAYIFRSDSLVRTAYDRNTNGAGCLAIGTDATVFLGQGRAGIWGYRSVNGLLESTGLAPVAGEITDIAANKDGIVVAAARYSAVEVKRYHTDTKTFSHLFGIDSVRSALGVGLFPDGSIMVVDSSNVLRVFRFDDQRQWEVTKTDIPDRVFSIDIGPDSTIYLSCLAGLRLYRFENDQLQFRASCFNGGTASGTALVTDSTVVLANGTDGVRVYQLADGEFERLHRTIDDEAVTTVTRLSDGMFCTGNIDGQLKTWQLTPSGLQPVGSGRYGLARGSSSRKVIQISDSLVYLANGDGGLLALSYDGAHFDLISSEDFQNSVNDVAIGPDGTVFLAVSGRGAYQGLFAYRLEAAAWKKIGYKYIQGSATNVDVGPDGTVFIVSDRGVIAACSFDGSRFTQLATADEDTLGMAVYSVTVHSDGAVFLAGESPAHWAKAGYLRVYDFDGTKFTLKASAITGQRNTGGTLTFADDGTIYFAGSKSGLLAYRYAELTGIEDPKSGIVRDMDLAQNYPNPVRSSTIIPYTVNSPQWVTLRVYDALGREIATPVNSYHMHGDYSTEVDLSAYPGGLYFYRLQFGNGEAETRRLVILR